MDQDVCNDVNRSSRHKLYDFFLTCCFDVIFWQSTGGFYAISRLAGATPPPPHVISRGIGWQGIGILLNGAFGTFTGATVAP